MTDTYVRRTGFTIERTFTAPVARLYRAWTDPQELSRWIWASLGREAWAEVDLRVGGAYRVYSRVAGGRHQGEGWSGMCGLYVAVEPERHLVFTLHWDADVGYNQGEALTLDELISVTFAVEGDGTRLTVQHLGIPDDGRSVQGHRQGMEESLELLCTIVS